jgi:hypothetical protein
VSEEVPIHEIILLSVEALPSVEVLHRVQVVLGEVQAGHILLLTTALQGEVTQLYEIQVSEEHLQHNLQEEGYRTLIQTEGL